MNVEDRKRLEEIKHTPDFGAVRYPDQVEPQKAYEQANAMRDWLIARLEAEATALESAERRAAALEAENRRLRVKLKEYEDFTAPLRKVYEPGSNTAQSADWTRAPEQGCPACGGSGVSPEEHPSVCRACEGTGRLSQGREATEWVCVACGRAHKGVCGPMHEAITGEQPQGGAGEGEP